ncbi:hypothetical protein GCM10022233_70410 [Streptomyces shaanxiensis]|uniref:Uncharacterized protein n=1 Tax=Streptomyces shaanxiensis TaxID=653357 RepID=A0ABP7W3H0_9ACTN
MSPGGTLNLSQWSRASTPVGTSSHCWADGLVAAAIDVVLEPKAVTIRQTLSRSHLVRAPDLRRPPVHARRPRPIEAASMPILRRIALCR